MPRSTYRSHNRSQSASILCALFASLPPRFIAYVRTFFLLPLTPCATVPAVGNSPLTV